jgi:hypothetical protein
VVQVSFQSEVLAAIDELQGTYTTLLDTQDVLMAVQQENTALKERCSEFVRANLDHMLAWRTLKATADALEGKSTACGHQVHWRAVASRPPHRSHLRYLIACSSILAEQV